MKTRGGSTGVGDGGIDPLGVVKSRIHGMEVTRSGKVASRALSRMVVQSHERPPGVHQSTEVEHTEATGMDTDDEVEHTEAEHTEATGMDTDDEVEHTEAEHTEVETSEAERTDAQPTKTECNNRVADLAFQEMSQYSQTEAYDYTWGSSSTSLMTLLDLPPFPYVSRSRDDPPPTRDDPPVARDDPHPIRNDTPAARDDPPLAQHNQSPADTGGPVELDLLGDRKEKVLTAHRHLNWLIDLSDLRRRHPGPWLELAERSGLLCLHDLEYKGVDHTLITEFVERWHPETNTFHFPFGELTITLHDVLLLNGMPIEGESMALHMKDKDIRGWLTESFEWSDADLGQYTSNGGIARNDLTTRFSTYFSGRRCSGQQWDYHTSNNDLCSTAYLMIFLGATLFIDKSTNRIKHWFADFVLDHNRTGGLAWGVGALAILYRQLGEASRKGVQSIAGCTTLLQSWILYHFPSFGKTANIDTSKHGDYRFDVRLSFGNTPGMKGDRVVAIRKALDEVIETDVTWMPYRPLELDGKHRVSLYRGGY